MELCFLQYYEIVHRDDLDIDGVDSALNCIRIMWNRTPDDRNFSSEKEFLVPADSIQRLAHTVGADFTIPQLGSDVELVQEYNALIRGEEGCLAHLFYANRFIAVAERSTISKSKY